MLADALAIALLACAPDAMVLADARPPALLALVPSALVLADARAPALLECAPDALVLADARALVAVVTLPPRSTAPTVAGCRLVGCSVVSGRPLRSRAVAAVLLHVCVGRGPGLASPAPSPPAAAAAAWRGRGRVPIAGWSLGGVGQDSGLRARHPSRKRGPGAG